jgi:hypothetical protein
MADKKQLTVYAASYQTIDAAVADLDAIEQLHKDEVGRGVAARLGQRTRPSPCACMPT